jgi:hypothetical protein
MSSSAPTPWPGPRRRLGPLTAIGGVEPALAIADVASRHVRLTAASVTRHLGETALDVVPWDDVAGLALHLPTTRWPHPLLPEHLLPILVGVLGGGAPASESPPLSVEIATAEGVRSWALESHYTAGYRRGDAQRAVRLLDHLTSTPSSRALLSHPLELLSRLSAIARGGG